MRSERELLSTLPERLDWLWFLGFDLDRPSRELERLAEVASPLRDQRADQEGAGPPRVVAQGIALRHCIAHVLISVIESSLGTCAHCETGFDLDALFARSATEGGERVAICRDSALIVLPPQMNVAGEIRDTVNRGWRLGSERFKDEIERALACAVRPPKRGRPTRSIMLQGKPFG